MVVQADAPEGHTVEVRLLDAHGAEAVPAKAERIRPGRSMVTVVLEAADLPPGEYQTRTTILQPDGGLAGEPAVQPVLWPGRAEEFKGVRILNNFVWELLRVEREKVRGSKAFAFTSPKRRWMYLTATARPDGGSLRLFLDGHEEILSFERGESGTKEAMRYLPKGHYNLKIEAPGGGDLDHLVVRSIPEIILHELTGLKIFNDDLGMSILEFYETYVNKNVNTFIAALNSSSLQPALEKWKKNGGRVLGNAVAKGVAHGIEYCLPEEIFEYIVSTRGYAHPLSDGTTLDEFSGPCVNCPSYAAALRRLKATPEFKDKLLYFYDTNIEFNSEQGRERLQAIVDTDSVILWERYLSTAHDKFLPNPSEAAVQNFLQTEYGLAGMARTCRAWEPKAIEHLAVCFGFFSAPGGHMLNTTPSINHKVFLDMQFNFVANDPAFWGTYGLMGYHSSYSDEETLRWLCRLFRHYGIEGNSGPATDDPYVSPHLINGDFAQGTEGWTIVSAEPGSAETGHKPGLSALQTRYGSSKGDTGLITTRSDKRPNTFTQEIRDLQPGRLYTFRMMVCDYQDLSKRDNPEFRIKLENVERIPEESFSTVFPDESFIFPDQHDTWLTYSWHLFRAKDKSAHVTITDWKSDDEPGGPQGQQLIFNFLQVHPYFDH